MPITRSLGRAHLEEPEVLAIPGADAVSAAGLTPDHAHCLFAVAAEDSADRAMHAAVSTCLRPRREHDKQDRGQ
jgi:hypothetical protein